MGNKTGKQENPKPGYSQGYKDARDEVLRKVNKHFRNARYHIQKHAQEDVSPTIEMLTSLEDKIMAEYSRLNQ